MQLSNLKRSLVFLALLLLPPGAAGATSILQMNLAQLADGADLIVRGTIIEVSEIRVAVGGGEIAALHYKVEVDETFKGRVANLKGVAIAEFKVLGTLRKLDAREALMPGWPELHVGREYLLFVAPAGPTGLTVTMGIGQGCFAISSSGQEETAVNGFDNAGLFDGMPPGNLPRSGPLAYRDLADRVRAHLGP
jgi:hypothetical protein